MAQPLRTKQPNVILDRASDIRPEPIAWLWEQWLAKGKLHILAGAPGTGKTTIAIHLAGVISKGGRYPDGKQAKPGSVLIWSAEDSPRDTLVPRLMAVQADLDKVSFISKIIERSGIRGFDPAIDMDLLLENARQIDDLALLVIDPIVNVVAGDSHKNGEVRRALQPVVDFAERLGCAILGITHFSKGGQGKDPLERVTGSLAFGALARIVMATAKTGTSEHTKRIFSRAKSNIGIDGGGFEYFIQQMELGEGIFSSHIEWGELLQGSARDLLGEPEQKRLDVYEQSALEDAKDFLRDLLADGELPQKEVEAKAKECGHSVATLRRAKTDLRAKAVKSKMNNCWYWRLD